MIPDVAYIAIGSNIGDRDAHLERARRELAALPGSRIIAASEIEETAALTVDDDKQGKYLNQIVALETSLSAEELLDDLHRIEKGAGRKRGRKWGPRTLDLDIVLFGGQIINTPSLTVPHPELANRDFWQRELRQIRAEI